MRVKHTPVKITSQSFSSFFTKYHSGAWTNSIQPIWLAGKVMSHPSEHRTILSILERIQRETGWQTSWRREDLKAWWGDTDD